VQRELVASNHYTCFNPARDRATKISLIQFRFIANLGLWGFTVAEVVG
jgi:hypothetical protein